MRETYVILTITQDDTGQPKAVKDYVDQPPDYHQFDQYNVMENDVQQHRIHLYVRGTQFNEYELELLARQISLDLLDRR